MKDYKNYYIISAEPEVLYQALTNPATIRLWSGEPAEMSTEAGSEFSLWDGSITGKNILFEKGKKIVQEWYFGDQEEKSIVTIILHTHKQGTSAGLYRWISGRQQRRFPKPCELPFGGLAR